MIHLFRLKRAGSLPLIKSRSSSLKSFDLADSPEEGASSSEEADRSTKPNES